MFVRKYTRDRKARSTCCHGQVSKHYFLNLRIHLWYITMTFVNCFGSEMLSIVILIRYKCFASLGTCMVPCRKLLLVVCSYRCVLKNNMSWLVRWDCLSNHIRYLQMSPLFVLSKMVLWIRYFSSGILMVRLLYKENSKTQAKRRHQIDQEF